LSTSTEICDFDSLCCFVVFFGVFGLPPNCVLTACASRTSGLRKLWTAAAMLPGSVFRTSAPPMT